MKKYHKVFQKNNINLFTTLHYNSELCQLVVKHDVYILILK